MECWLAALSGINARSFMASPCPNHQVLPMHTKYSTWHCTILSASLERGVEPTYRFSQGVGGNLKTTTIFCTIGTPCEQGWGIVNHDERPFSPAFFSRTKSSFFDYTYSQALGNVHRSHSCYSSYGPTFSVHRVTNFGGVVDTRR